MENARILHCEDHPRIQEGVENILAIRGLHKVVAVAETVGDSKKRIDEIKAGRLVANLILLDGQLSGGISMNHPKVITEWIKWQGLDIPVIGLSTEGLSTYGLEVGRDIVADLIKQKVFNNPKLLDKAIHKLPEPAVNN